MYCAKNNERTVVIGHNATVLPLYSERMVVCAYKHV